MQKVSVIVPTYNQAQYLQACLDSIWFQDYENLEIIIVNDGSTDDSALVIQGYQNALLNDRASYASYYDEELNKIKITYHKRYPRQGREMKVITHEKNRGLASALNTGFEACTGDYCTYVPSDDISYPSMISEMAKALEENEVDFVYADMFIVDDQGSILRRFALPDYSFQGCFGDWYLCGVAKLYKRSLHDKWGYYEEHLLAHDHELFQRFAVNGAKFYHIPKVLMGVRDHSNGREVEIHASDNWNRLLEESIELVKTARKYI